MTEFRVIMTTVMDMDSSVIAEVGEVRTEEAGQVVSQLLHLVL